MALEASIDMWDCIVLLESKVTLSAGERYRTTDLGLEKLSSAGEQSPNYSRAL